MPGTPLSFTALGESGKAGPGVRDLGRVRPAGWGGFIFEEGGTSRDAHLGQGNGMRLSQLGILELLGAARIFLLRLGRVTGNCNFFLKEVGLFWAKQFPSREAAAVMHLGDHVGCGHVFSQGQIDKTCPLMGVGARLRVCIPGCF